MEEIIRSVRAVWRIALGDVSKIGDLDTSLNGFWRSFRAAFICAVPVALYSFFLIDPPKGMAAAAPARWIIEASGFALQWTLWPFVMFFLTQALGKQDRFLTYATAFNWIQILTTGATTTISLFFALAFGATAASLIGIILLFGALFLEWSLTRRALDIDGAGALLVVLGNLFTIFMLASVTNSVLAFAAGA